MDCLSDVGNGVACKGKCETEVQQINELINRGKKAKAAYRNYYRKIALIWVLLSLAAFAMSLVLWQRNKDGIGLLPVAIVALVAAFVYASLTKNYSDKK